MSSGVWRFHLLPEEEHTRVIEAWDRLDFAGLVQILNQYRVPVPPLGNCCCIEPLSVWIPKAIQEGLLKSTENGK